MTSRQSASRGLGAVLAVWAGVASAAAADLPKLEDRRETFGAVVGPAVLPAGGTSAYAFLGAPEVGAGYRHGLGGAELELRATLDYFELSAAAELIFKVSLLKSREFELAGLAGLGLVGDTGARYLDERNFTHLAARGLLGAVAAYRASEIVRVLGTLDVPGEWALQATGGGRFRPMAGAGAEIYLGEDVTGLVLGQLGADWIKQPGGVPDVRLGWGVRLGIGFRLF